MHKILLIQTAFIGDVVLATSLLETIYAQYPNGKIHILVRKGNESLLTNHPFLEKVWILDKKKKWSSAFRLIRSFRKEQFDFVVNVQRFFVSGFIAGFSKGKRIVGFQKNPLSFLFHKRVEHTIDINGTEHEIDRNYKLLEELDCKSLKRPQLYPSRSDFDLVHKTQKYITCSPASVWFTKQYPIENWVRFINSVPVSITVYLLGGPNDRQLCQSVQKQCVNTNIKNCAGKYSFLQSTALMKHAAMNYVNDSAPLHFASAVNAPVTALFCSTVPAFGFYPLSDQTTILETKGNLACRPCGLHGKRQCPEGHFKCGAYAITPIL